MLKAIMLRIAAFILIVAGELVLLFGCEYASSSLGGVFELLGCVAALIACFLLAIYCCWTADDIEDSPALGETQPNNNTGRRQPHNPPTNPKGTTMEEDEDMTCPLCKHEMRRQHMQMLGVYGYVEWWECDWCGYATDQQEHIFTAKETK